ncbi:MAG: tyrosine-type recombinase/integrase [Aestuariivirga sp.]
MAADNRKHWTERGLLALKSQERKDYRDPSTDGLVLRVSPSGAKSWALIYRRKGDGYQRRFTIGAFGPGQGQFTLAAARDEADKLWGEIARGKDPGQGKANVAKAETVAELLDLFIAKHKKPNAAWTKECARVFEKDVKPVIGHFKLPELTRPQVRQVLDRVEKRGATATVNRTLAAMRRALQWAVEQDMLTVNPATSIKTEIEEKPKDRALSEAEIKTFWAGLEDAETPIGQRVRIALKLVLLTGQRPGEVSGALKAELDMDAALWRLPEGRTKNGKAHTVPLHPLAVALFKEAMALDPDCPFVFCVRGRSVAKASATPQAMQSHALSKAMMRAQKDLGLSKAPATPHDLRRTAATHMARLGFQMAHVAAVLNHGLTSRRSITERVYVHHEFLPEKAAALMAWGNEVERLTGKTKPHSNVLAMRA